jgi:hypothetical protein
MGEKQPRAFKFEKKKKKPHLWAIYDFSGNIDLMDV